MTGKGGSMPDNFLLIIGAMKSGTTSLFEILSQHPEIASARIKEPDYFSDAEVMKRGDDWYRALWNWNPETHKIALEASVAYSKTPGQPSVAERIASFDGGRFRFVYMMRDPLEQIPSHARHALYAGWEKSMSEGIPAYMIDIVRYASQIDKFVEHFPREDILLVTLDEFSADPESVLERICRFAGVSDDFEFHGSETRYNSGGVYEMSRGLSAVLNTRIVQTAKSLVPRSLWHWARGKVARRLNDDTSPQKSFELTEQQAADIQHQLADEFARLKSVYGVDVDKYWARP